MTGTTLGHYRVQEKIGAGGMGEVYRARDEKLERDVAIKILPTSSFQDAAARSRLLQEARAAAVLNHPHICTIYEIGEVEGHSYIAMELVEGEPLDSRLTAGPLPATEVVRYGLQLADALAHAHERGVIHRDLKCGNVMITPDGRVKMLDFGLAKRIRGEELSGDTTGVQLTNPGALVGTLAYVAPEQLRGFPADVRSDIWALGVVLYEMSAGQRPFQGNTSFELSSAILNQPHLPLPRQVPEELKAAIRRCLTKEPARRYQRAGELRAALETLQSGLGRPRQPEHRERRPRRKVIRAIAVLPLENLSRDPEQEYFAEGMTEQLITDLSKIGALKVISRTSSMRYKGTNKSLPEIAEELKVDAVVEGSVLRAGDRVRISAQLIRAATDTHLWAESYERDAQDVLVLQSEVARAIARQIEVVVTPEEAGRLAGARRVNPEAHEAYLKGCFHWYRLTPQDLERSMQFFQLALQKDPDYALAHVGMARFWGGCAAVGAQPPRDVWPKAKVEAAKAIELDESLAEAHDILAWVLTWFEYDWSAAEKKFQRGLELNPNYAHGHLFYGLFLNSMRRWEEAKSQTERALELDPQNFFFWWILGFELLCRRQYDEAITQIRKSLAMEPNFLTAHWGLWSAFQAKQMYEEALPEAKGFLSLFAQGVPEATEALASGYAEAGYPEAMRRAAEKLAERSGGGMYIDPYVIAGLFTSAGEKDRALEWLEKAYQDRAIQMVYLNVHPAWDKVRAHPRFQNLLRKMNFPQ